MLKVPTHSVSLDSWELRLLSEARSEAAGSMSSRSRPEMASSRPEIDEVRVLRCHAERSTW